MSRNQKSAGQYMLNIDQLLGEGSFAKVYTGYRIDDPDTIYAIKMIDNVKLMNPKVKAGFDSEVEVTRLVHHNNIVRLHSYFVRIKICANIKFSILPCSPVFRSLRHITVT